MSTPSAPRPSTSRPSTSRPSKVTGTSSPASAPATAKSGAGTSPAWKPSAETGRAAGSTRLDPDELAALEDQRDFLLRSLEDLEREHDAGDLDDGDYHTLRDDYTARAAETLRALDERRVAFADARRRSGRGRTLAVSGGVIAFAVMAGLLVASSLGARQAGDSATGGISTQESPSQRAQQCIPKMAPQAPSGAISCFQAVLDDDPRNVVALAWLGWQLELSSSFAPEEQQAALQASSGNLIEGAVAADPDYSYARAFRAVVAFRRQDYALAKQYLAEFRERDPSPDAESVISQFDLDAQIDRALAEGANPGTGATSPPITTPSTTTPSTSGSPSTSAPG